MKTKKETKETTKEVVEDIFDELFANDAATKRERYKKNAIKRTIEKKGLDKKYDNVTDQEKKARVFLRTKTVQILTEVIKGTKSIDFAKRFLQETFLNSENSNIENYYGGDKIETKAIFEKSLAKIFAE